ncbi:MAG: septation protein SpoVG family protein [Elusimicrobia bacterium]|nr:septation protein SpoVG family protein [Elusimicrobiota bacterium]
MRENTQIPDLEVKVDVRRLPAAWGNEHLLAVADLFIGEAFVIRDIHILEAAKEGTGSLQVAFPSRRWNGEEKRCFDIAFPVTTEAHRRATIAILRAFEDAEAKACQRELRV